MDTDNVTGDIVDINVYDGRGLLLEVSGENTSGADIYVQIFDLAAVPADGCDTDLLFSPVRVGAGERFEFVFSESDKVYTVNGLVICASSTQYTKTAVLVGSMEITVRYKQ